MPSADREANSRKETEGGKLFTCVVVLCFTFLILPDTIACNFVVFGLYLSWGRMQVIIQSTGNITEYSIIEFQGDLETKSEEALGGKVIGDLHFNHEGNPIMIIGHHILHGKVQDLDKPLVVITKENDGIPEENNVKYEVTAVIKRKLIFKTRPKPIVGEMIKKL